ncbi:hypothetical protein [Bradyrhizobium sp. ORS 285]|uniref:hypothetical protein n=1 Tax=Bradyrhizobium sp. ORS 285 TaxID=115808 RepID=UPI00031A436E|nr:hypothetical protein [Bradyrhizobium sp. ORS 285]
MKRLLILAASSGTIIVTAPAFGADIIEQFAKMKAFRPVATQIVDWSGYYLGIKWRLGH